MFMRIGHLTIIQELSRHMLLEYVLLIIHVAYSLWENIRIEQSFEEINSISFPVNDLRLLV